MNVKNPIRLFVLGRFYYRKVYSTIQKPIRLTGEKPTTRQCGLAPVTTHMITVLRHVIIYRLPGEAMRCTI